MARIVGVCMSTVLTSGVVAGTMGPDTSNHWAPVVTLSLGPSWAEAGNNQTLFLTTTIEKTYTVTQKSNALLTGELFYGWQKALDHNLLGQIGFAVLGAGNAKVSGQIWDDANPEFNNLAYSYKINHAHIALKGKFIADLNQMLMPYVSASAGLGMNHAYDYSNTPLIFEALPNANFADNTRATFTYTLGIGVQRALSQFWQAGVGYEFADWGKTRLGLAPGQTIDSGLSMNHLFTNSIMFHLTYLA